jgi:hypothetical protein
MKMECKNIADNMAMAVFSYIEEHLETLGI